MNRFLLRTFAAIVAAALAVPALLAGTIRTVDFESPAPYPDPTHHLWELYSGYEASFEYGIREPPLGTWTSSTMYWGGPGICSNCDYGPVRVFFSKPVKNIHFTLFNLFGAYIGPIHWDTREFFTDVPRFGMNVSPFMNSMESRSVAVPAEHVRYLDIDTGHWIGLDDFTFEVEDDAQTASTYRVDLAFYTNPGQRPVSSQTITPGTAVNAQIALGTVFSVGVSKRTPDASGGPATITSIASTYTRSADSVAPALETDVNLFANSPVVQLAPDPTGAVTELLYAAVHQGTVKFTLTPFAIGAPATVTLNLSIVRPSALGGEHNDWDKAVIDAAHERGIPPQVIKGQIRQESPTFKQDEFRYEPCSSDFAQISRGARLIDKAPYNLYAMDGVLTDAGFAPTADLRNQLYMLDSTDPTGRRHIRHSDTGVTARTIWDASDNWKGHGQKWSLQTCRALDDFIRAGNDFDDFLDALDFTAQTPTAASYGVMQAMYSTALEYKWSVDDPASPGQKTQTPRYLYDSAEALQLKHGGSIWVGGHEDVQRYWDAHIPEPTLFPSQDSFFDSFEEPLRNYTGGGKSQQDYGKNIIDEWQYDYLPVQPSPIFY